MFPTSPYVDNRNWCFFCHSQLLEATIGEAHTVNQTGTSHHNVCKSSTDECSGQTSLDKVAWPWGREAGGIWVYMGDIHTHISSGSPNIRSNNEIFIIHGKVGSAFILQAWRGKRLKKLMIWHANQRSSEGESVCYCQIHI